MFAKAGKVIGVVLTVAYGAYLVVSTVREAKLLADEIKLFKEAKKGYTRSANGWKPEGKVIETCFVD